MEGDITFDTNGPLTAGITHAPGTAGITIANAGAYGGGRDPADARRRNRDERQRVGHDREAGLIRTSPGARTLWMAVAIAAAVIGACCSTAATAGSNSAVPRTQELALLARPQAIARTAGGLMGHLILRATRPITGEQTAVPVLAEKRGADGDTWLHVMLPGRPNGSTGWIRGANVQLVTTPWRVVVHTDSRTVDVYRDGGLVRSLRAVVGKPSTPTPHGTFFVEESVAMLPGSAGAPFALALSARSKVLQEFEGGPGQIAIHGVGNLGGAPGTAVSHGCVRLADSDIRWLVARVTTGVPVTILA